MDTDTKHCMACSCPCDLHKEHNHPIEGNAKVCEMCGRKLKEDGSYDCGCKK